MPVARTTPSFTLSWLLDALEGRGYLETETRRDLEVRAPQQRARIIKQYEGEKASTVDGQRLRYAPSPAEIIASLRITDVTGAELDDDRLARVVADEAGAPYYKIDPLKLDMDFVVRTLSRPFALRHVVLPLMIEDGTLVLAVENPFDTEVLEALARIMKGAVRTVVSSRRDILKCITEFYGFRRSVESAAREAQATDPLGDFEQLVELRQVGEIEATDQHVVNAVDFLFSYAFDQRASDIHIEPRRGDTQVRLRIDGLLHNVHTIPRRVHTAVLSRLKTLARMDIAERRRPQDGRIKTVLGDKEVELRVSTLPVAFGEKVVIRIFDPTSLLVELSDLGFEGADLATFERWIAKPHGLVLVTGPTGSGKTTTLYTALRTLADETVNVVSVEDPIEMITEHFNQVAVQPKIDVDFPTALRTILRQDPDVIMVGEIRDGATAGMAVQAALTGHLVFSTLHTNDAVTAITRLLDMGIPGFLIGSTIVGVMAQRLVRKVCDGCRVGEPMTRDQMAALGITTLEAARFSNLARGTGCPKCRGTGYFGRTGVFEMLELREGLRDAVLRGASGDELRSAAELQGLRTLRECSLDRLAQGITAVEEVVRVIGVGGIEP